MRPKVLPALASALMAASAGAGTARAAAAEPGPWLQALSAKYVVIDTATGDLDGDGKDETAVCYREDVSRTDQASGIAIYAGKGADARPVFHVQLDDVLCEKLKLGAHKLGILLSGNPAGGNKELVWSYGKEITFRGDKGSFASGITVRASSSLDSGHGPDKAVDGDLTTSWSEGADGTGLGQTITLHLPKPTDVGAIAIFAGNGSSKRAYFDDNRLHRGSIEAKTEADLGDSAAGVDFSSLGIETMGDRLDFTCENKPEVTYVRVKKKDVVELQLRIESVYLGDKNDDAHIAEIEVVPLLNLSQTVDRAKQVKPPDAAQGADKKKPAAPDGNDAVKKLDASGSLIKDDL